MSVKRMTQLSLLTAAALILYVIELQLPSLVPIPGVKLGLANIITVVAVYRFRPYEAAILVAVRVILGAFFAGNLSALLFSGCGAALCLCGMLLLGRVISVKYIPLCSVLGAMLHNAGQIAAAVWVVQSTSVLVYLPILMVTGGIAGLFTGLCAQAVERRLPASYQRKSCRSSKKS
ncbi:MAG: Gx transporter family protein [Acetatifactor sp.]|nr:Gx transporter family protein [Acetatifactor sp.]